MGVKRRQGVSDQPDLFDEALKALARHGVTGDGGTGAGARAEPQAPTAWDQNRALTQHLMEEVAHSANLEQAFLRVRANHGAPGCDGMSVADLPAWMAENRDGLIVSLLDGSYRPQPVRGVEMPKPNGGVRHLGIPTVRPGGLAAWPGRTEVGGTRPVGAAAQEAMSTAWFRTLGLVGFADHHAALNPAGNRRGTRSVCPVV